MGKVNEVVNVGIVGCGRIADVHSPGYENSNDARIYAVCDANADIARARKAQWNAVKSYTDFTEMLSDPDLDAVEILTPQNFHEPMMIEAANAKKHIAVQKPMTIDLKSADRMVKAADDNKIIFKVTDNYGFYPPFIFAKKLINDGVIGTPHSLRIKFISGGSGGWEIPPGSWEWRMKENEAGRGIQTFDHGHHLWTTAWYLLGDVERVKSWIDSIDGIIDCPAMVMWKYKDSKKYGVCEYTHADEMEIPSKYYANDEWFEISGSRGLIKVSRCTGNIHGSEPIVSVFTGKKWEHYSDIKSDWVEGFIGSTKNFIAAVKGDEKPLLSPQQGREMLKLNLAVSKSSRHRREVYLDEMDAISPEKFTRKKIAQELREKYPSKTFFSSFVGEGSAKYAPQAIELTRDLVGRFDASKVMEWKAEIGIHILEQGKSQEKKFTAIFNNGRLDLIEDRLPEDSTLVIECPAGTWAAILLKKKRIETAFIQGKIKITQGKPEEALKLRAAFGL